MLRRHSHSHAAVAQMQLHPPSSSQALPQLPHISIAELLKVEGWDLSESCCFWRRCGWDAPTGESAKEEHTTQRADPLQLHKEEENRERMSVSTSFGGEFSWNFPYPRRLLPLESVAREPTHLRAIRLRSHLQNDATNKKRFKKKWKEELRDTNW